MWPYHIGMREDHDDDGDGSTVFRTIPSGSMLLMMGELISPMCVRIMENCMQASKVMCVRVNVCV